MTLNCLGLYGMSCDMVAFLGYFWTMEIMSFYIYKHDHAIISITHYHTTLLGKKKKNQIAHCVQGCQLSGSPM